MTADPHATALRGCIKMHAEEFARDPMFRRTGTPSPELSKALNDDLLALGVTHAPTVNDVTNDVRVGASRLYAAGEGLVHA